LIDPARREEQLKAENARLLLALENAVRECFRLEAQWQERYRALEQEHAMERGRWHARHKSAA
jgi:hypothetical protein